MKIPAIAAIPASDEFFIYKENIMTLLELVIQDGHPLKRKPSNSEFEGSCPWCGGKDRFNIVIDKRGERYFCRVCGRKGDAIQYLRDYRKMSFLEACKYLKIKPSANRALQHGLGKKKTIEVWTPKESIPPSKQWQEQAAEYIDTFQFHLWAYQGIKAREFLHSCGLNDSTMKTAGLGVNTIDRFINYEDWGFHAERNQKGNLKKVWMPPGITFSLEDQRIRIRRFEGEPRYVNVSGSNMKPMVISEDKFSVVIIVESDIDAWLIWQEAGDLVGVVALGSAVMRSDKTTHDLLMRAKIILLSLDADEAGARESQEWWKVHYPKAKRWPVPIGKDPSEAWKQGLNIREWIEAGIDYAQIPFDIETDNLFPLEWIRQFDDEQLERLAIQTIEGRIPDREAMNLICR